MPELIRAFAFLFLLMSAYYIIQPLRDEIGLLLGSKATPGLFRWSLVVMLVTNPLLGLAMARLPRSRLVVWVFRFFLCHLVVFVVGFKASGDAATLEGWRRLLPAAYYLWVGVFNLFCVSLFWSTMADTFAPAQARRYFGFIGAGASLGQMAGSTLAALGVTYLGPTNLLLVAACLLEFSLQFRPRNLPVALSGPEKKQDPPPRPWTGISQIFRSPYLLGICLYLFLYTFTSSFLYFQKQELVELSLGDRERRVQFFSSLNLVGSVATLIVQVFLAGRLLSRLGLVFCLALVPTLSIFGFGGLAMVGSLTFLAIFDLTRKTANYGVARPSREVLFTVVPAEQKYLSKNFIDTFVYRAGDAVASLAFDAVKLGFHFGTGALSWIAVPFCILWLGVGLALGKANQRRTLN